MLSRHFSWLFPPETACWHLLWKGFNDVKGVLFIKHQTCSFQEKLLWEEFCCFQRNLFLSQECYSCLWSFVSVTNISTSSRNFLCLSVIFFLWQDVSFLKLVLYFHNLAGIYLLWQLFYSCERKIFCPSEVSELPLGVACRT